MKGSEEKAGKERELWFWLIQRPLIVESRRRAARGLRNE